MMKKFIKIFGFVAGGVVLTQMYQNCSQFEVMNSDLSSLSMSSSILPDSAHPGQKELTPPTQHVLVANKVYVSALMRDIFARTDADIELENLINKWIMFRPAQFGGSCNPYDSYSARDCGGDISNANLPQSTDHNTVRESFRLQFCENILGKDEFVSAVLGKITSTAAGPNANSIEQVYKLFYRDQDINPLTINSLVDMDHNLAQKSEVMIDRWRAVILQVCESPGWQLL